MTRQGLEDLIRSAFEGVELGDGFTLVDLDEMSNWGERASQDDIREYPDAEIRSDWSALSLTTMERFSSLSHADVKTMRYYLPAFMLSVLSNYDCVAMRCISAISALYPDRSGSGEYTISRYDLFNDKQRAACALYMRYLPELVDLDRNDQKIIERALRNYWVQYLSENL